MLSTAVAQTMSPEILSASATDLSRLHLKLRQEDIANKDSMRVALRPKIGYRITDTSVLRAWTEFKTEGYNNRANRQEEIETTYWAVRFDDLKFLNQKEHGIDLRLILRYQSFFNRESEKKYGEASQSAIRFFTFRKFNEKWRFENKNKFKWIQTRQDLVAKGKENVIDTNMNDITARIYYAFGGQWESFFELYSLSGRKFSGNHYNNLKANPGLRYYFSDTFSTEVRASRMLTTSGDNKFWADGNLGGEHSITWKYAKGSELRFKTKTQFIDPKTRDFSSKTTRDNLSFKLLINYEIM